MAAAAGMRIEADSAMLRAATVRGFVVAAAVLLLGVAPARAGNLVVNGSFEDGLNGWTIGGTDGPGQGSGFPPAAIYYNSAAGYPDGAFGEAVPFNNAPTNSPDAVGLRAAYFVSDLAHDQSLSQVIGPLDAGTYQIGFSAYAPGNGYANFYDATFSGVIATVQLANYSVKSGAAQTWQTFAGAANLAGGNYLVEFVFNTNGYPAADVVIDQVYVVAGNPPLPVPDGGATLSLLGITLLGIGAARRACRR